MKHEKSAVKVTGLLIICALAALAALILVFGGPEKSYAQAYYTNSNTQGGPYQYNSAFPTQLNPAGTLANQYAAGIQSGIITPGMDGDGGMLVSNMFTTNIYSTAPSISFSLGGVAGTNAIGWITAVTPTNFMMTLVTTSGATIYWTATGH